MSEPRQASLRRLRQFEVRPNRELGQNFLIDDNLLGVIERAAELAAGDVVLEVGGGLGVLSEHLASRVGHLHVVEIDPSLEPPLRDALDPFANTTLHMADAVKLDLPALDPAPTKVVANLPYGVAATVILETIARLPAVTLWVAMVQREVGERLAADPGYSCSSKTIIRITTVSVTSPMIPDIIAAPSKISIITSLNCASSMAGMFFFFLPAIRWDLFAIVSLRQSWHSGLAD